MLILSRTLLATAALAAITFAPAARAAAPRHDWYELNFINGQCESQHGDTPEGEHVSLRNHGIIDVPHVQKGDDGAVEYVTIELTPPGRSSAVTEWWFPSAATCELGRQFFMKRGDIQDSNDMR